MTDEYFMLEKVRYTIWQIEQFLQLTNALLWNDMIPLIDLEELRVKLHWLKRAEKVLANSNEE